MSTFRIFSCTFYLCFGSLFFVSCSGISPSERISEGSVVTESVKQTLAQHQAPLSASEYRAWLEAQKGVTYDKQENAQICLSLLYKTLNYEAAISEGLDSKKKLQEQIKLKQGFHYLLVECKGKNSSLTHKTDKGQIFNAVKENFYVVRNSSDTVRNVIMEFFPAQLMQQPDQILVLVKKEESEGNFVAGIKGKPFGLKDLKIEISIETLKSFPEIKL